MIWLGLAIVIATFYFIIRNYETRLVLIVSGAVMALLGGDLVGSVNSLVGEFVNKGLVPTIVTVMGFSYVMEYTGCSKNLVVFTTNLLKKVPIIILPGAVVVTFALNIALPSAAGIAAAVGTLLIPTLLSLGVRPAMAASVVYLGTWGSVMSPGLMFNPQVAQMANTDVMTVIASFTVPVLIALALAAALITMTAKFLKEGVGSTANAVSAASGQENFRINYLFAALPVVPIVLLVLGSKQVGLIPEITVPQAMLVGTALGFVLTRTNVTEATRRFFRGCGDGFCDVVGVIAAAAMFCKGMQAIGLTGTLIDFMKNSQSIAQIAAAFGPFVIAVISGTGNAAALAFNGAITPQAPAMGYGIMEMGSTVQIGAGLGRTMSPVSPSAIICAKLAGVSPVEISKRNALPTIAACLLVMLWLL